MKVDIFHTENKYKVIYADPPWSYKDKALAGNRGSVCKYPVMTTEDMIKRFPINNIADDDCILFMWVTMPKLNECFELIKACGFEYKDLETVNSLLDLPSKRPQSGPTTSAGLRYMSILGLVKTNKPQRAFLCTLIIDCNHVSC